MNQTEQMLRNALLEIQTSAEDCASGNYPWPHKQNYSDIAEHAKQALAAERAPLVRLNDDALVNIYLACKAEWKATNKRQRQRIAVMFGNAIMDAMDRANK